MRQYLLRRILLTLPSLALVSIVIFSLVRLLPGDAVIAQMGESSVNTPEQLQAIRERLGLDKPFHEQYFVWSGSLLRGNLGTSSWTGAPVAEQLVRALPVTIEIALLGLGLAMLIAIPVGVLSATRQDSISDYFGRLFSIAGLSFPDFWLATMFVVWAPKLLGWLPSVESLPLLKNPSGNFQQFLPAAIILGFSLSSGTMRLTRSALLEVLREDYVRTARAKGLAERLVISRHALRNALIPIVTIVGGQFGRLLGGTVIIETVFSLPGVGRLTINAITQRDYSQIQGNVMFFAVVMILINLLVDLTYSWLDPRIRYT